MMNNNLNDDSKRGGIFSTIVKKISDIEEWIRGHKSQNHAASTVVQVAYFQTGAMATGSTVIPIDDTIPQNTEGDQYMSLVFTPKSALNILDIEVCFNSSLDAVARRISVALFQDAISNSLACVSNNTYASTAISNTSFSHTMVAGTTSPITFNVRAGNGGGGVVTFNGLAGARLFGGVFASSIRVTERKP